MGSAHEISNLTALWDFLFLANPPSWTYLNYRIEGHVDSLLSFKDRLLSPAVTVDIFPESELLDAKVKQIMHVVGKRKKVYFQLKLVITG